MGVELLGKKLGMAQVFDAKGNFVGVTVIETGPCTVLQKKTSATDGYEACQIGFGERKAKHATKPLVGHCKKAGAASQIKNNTSPLAALASSRIRPPPLPTFNLARPVAFFAIVASLILTNLRRFCQAGRR